jgi:NitT/TauT family transport system substrate-binding protein
MLDFLNIRKWVLLSILMVTIFYICPSNINAQQASNSEPLKIALLPILDALPYYVAEARGYFKEYAVEVKVVPVVSGLQRDQLMQSGAIDGMLNEMITTANLNRDRVQVKTVIAARKAYPRYPLFRVLSSPATKLNLSAGLAGVPVGISKNTIIEYVTDRLLAAEGLNHQAIIIPMF